MLAVSLKSQPWKQPFGSWKEKEIKGQTNKIKYITDKPLMGQYWQTEDLILQNQIEHDVFFDAKYK